jgi:phage gp46-like protein
LDTLLAGGDHARNSRGLPIKLTGDRELIQRALLRLCVRKGSFAEDPGLGSELYKLAQARAMGAADMERLALSYAQEALLPMPQVSVAAVSFKKGIRGGGMPELAVTLKINGNHYALEVGYGL